MKKNTGILSKIYIAILLIFLYSPIAVLIFYSFNNGKTTVWKGFTFKWYVQLFRDDNIMNALWNTVIIAGLASVFATILGTAAAIGIGLMSPRVTVCAGHEANMVLRLLLGIEEP